MAQKLTQFSLGDPDTWYIVIFFSISCHKHKSFWVECLDLFIAFELIQRFEKKNRVEGYFFEGYRNNKPFRYEHF